MHGFLLRSILMTCIITMPTSVILAGGSASKPIDHENRIFSAEILTVITQAANQKVDQVLSEISADQKLNAALEYFRLTLDTKISRELNLDTDSENESEYQVFKNDFESYHLKNSDLMKDYKNELVIQEIHRQIKERYQDLILDEIQWTSMIS